MVGGEHRVMITQNTRGYAKQAGIITLKPATQIVNLVVGQTGFPDFFSSPSVEQRALTTEPVDISIRALLFCPARFQRHRGRILPRLQSRAHHARRRRTRHLGPSSSPAWATGPISPVCRSAMSPTDFQVVQPKSKRTMKDNSLFEGTLAEERRARADQTSALTPLRPGQVHLLQHRQRQLPDHPHDGRGSPSPSPPLPPPPLPQNIPGAPVQFSLNPPPASQNTSPQFPTAVPPVPPENLPRDPLTESHRGTPSLLSKETDSGSPPPRAALSGGGFARLAHARRAAFPRARSAAPPPRRPGKTGRHSRRTAGRLIRRAPRAAARVATPHRRIVGDPTCRARRPARARVCCHSFPARRRSVDGTLE